MPSWLYFYAAAATLWFSWFDIMDGMRARRLKCGSPIGRIVDEASDPYQYTLVSFIQAYILKIPPGWLCLVFVMPNLAQYCMEVRYVTTGSLIISSTSAQDGDFDIGPVEVELIFAIVFILAGIFGTAGITKPVAEAMPFLSSVAPKFLQVNHLIAAFWAILQVVFLVDALGGTFKENLKASLYMLLPPIIIFV